MAHSTMCHESDKMKKKIYTDMVAVPEGFTVDRSLAELRVSQSCLRDIIGPHAIFFFFFLDEHRFVLVVLLLKCDPYAFLYARVLTGQSGKWVHSI